MYSMKQVSNELNIPYETIKFYCKEGLVPNVQRDKNNYRLFDENNVAWLKSLQCLRKCGMSIKDIKKYLNYCLEGPSSIEVRQEMLNNTKLELLKKLDEINSSIEYIDQKQQYFEDIKSGKVKYSSNLIKNHSFD